jgi:hypothetical protein
MATTYGPPSCIEAPRRLRTMHEGGYINYAESQITSFPRMYDKQVSLSENSAACRVAETLGAPSSMDAGFSTWPAWRRSGSAISGRMTRCGVDKGEVRAHFRPARRAVEPEYPGC